MNKNSDQKFINIIEKWDELDKKTDKKLDKTFEKFLEQKKLKLSRESNKLQKKSMKILKNNSTSSNKKVKQIVKVGQENSDYATKLKNIGIPNFEKLRRHCNNLKNNNEADSMQEYFATNGKMHKALLYSTFDEFLDRLEGKTINIIDWDCKQGMATTLLLDFIREKQIDIKVSKVVLVEKDQKALNRAVLHVDVIKQDKLKVVAIDTIIKDIVKNKKTLTIHLFANETLHVELSKVDSSLFLDSYTVCISNKSDEILNDVYEKIDALVGVDKTLLNEKSKVGRFKKFAMVIKTDTIKSV